MTDPIRALPPPPPLHATEVDFCGALYENLDPDGATAALSRRRGTVTAVNVTTQTVTVNVGGTSIAGVKYVASYGPVVNDVVYVDFLDGDPVVTGALSPITNQPVIVLGRQYYQNVTNVTFNDSNVDHDTGLAINGLVIPNNHLIRFDFQFWAAGGPVTEWYFRLKLDGGGGFASYGESRFAPVGGNSPSPLGSMYAKSGNSNWSNLNAKITVATLAAGAATVFIGSGNTLNYSTFVVSDWGPIA